MSAAYATEHNVQLPPSDLLNSYTPANGLNDAFRCPSATFDEGGWHYSAPVRIFLQPNSNADLSLYRIDRAVRTSEVLFAAEDTQGISGNPRIAHYQPGNPLMDQPILGSTGPNL